MKFIVNGKEYSKFTGYSITDDYNSIAVQFSFNGFSDDYESMLYKECEIYLDDGTFLTLGKIHSINTSVTPEPSEPNITGYSTGGIIEDVMASINSYPLERSNVNIEDVIRLFWGAYNQGYAVVDDDYEKSIKPFEKISVGITQNVKQAVNKLIIQRGLFLSHYSGENPALAGTPLLVGDPLKTAKIYDIEDYIQRFSKAVNGRAIHSKIHVHLQADDDNDGKIYTLTNDFVTENRERHETMKDGNVDDMPDFARKIMSQEMLNISASFNSTKYVPIGNLVSIKNENWFIINTSITGDSAGEVFSYKAVPEIVYKR